MLMARMVSTINRSMPVMRAMPCWVERNRSVLMDSHLVHDRDDAGEIDGRLGAARRIEGICKCQSHFDGADVVPIRRQHVLRRLVPVGTARRARTDRVDSVLNDQILYAGHQRCGDYGIGGQAPQ